MKLLALAPFLIGAAAIAASPEADRDFGVLFQTDFSRAELNQTPGDLKVLQGAFTVREEDGNRFLELPGAPLDFFVTLFGPSEKSEVGVSARIYGTKSGRRFPAFGVGLNGFSGYRLQVVPAKRQIELAKNQEVKASVPYRWESGTWTHLDLQVRKVNDTWKIEGKVWPDGKPEPDDWTITCEEDGDLYPGPASISGRPYSGTPIRYDDLKVVRLSAVQ